MTEGLTRVLAILLVILMAAMVLDVTWQIVTRFIMKNPSSFTEELAGFLLVWIGLLGSSYALYTKAHLGIDIISSRVSGVRKLVIEIGVYIIIIVFSLFVMLIGGLRLMTIAFQLNQVSPSLGIPIGYVYVVLPLTGIILIYYSIYFIIMAFKKDKITEPAKSVSAVD
ncbi:MAG: TRAP transporter small permease [Calditrichaeota bacterium]|nr:TRAP transporter small permease [Calditrichota bacterium]